VKRLIFAVPVLAFVVLAVFLWRSLGAGSPTYVVSLMVGRPAPDITLPALDSQSEGFAREELAKGGPTVVNFWASWCLPCRAEHPILQALVQNGQVKLYGVDYQDKPEAARGFLERLGNPFGKKINSDQQGRVSIDWGVTGVPETFVIDGDGVIRAHYAGPLTEEVVQRLILPAMAAPAAAKD